MNNKYILLLALMFYKPVFATDLYYYVSYKHQAEKAITCDRYVRDYSLQFYDDMRTLITTYQNKQYKKTLLTLEKYGVTKDSDRLLDNKFVNSVLTCSAIYKFNGDINYYREFMTTMTLFISNIGGSVINSYPHDNGAQDLYNKTINYFNIVLSSENKTANKALNSDADKARAR